MSRSLVALDLETTGLDPERDAIIEIGAVRFKGERVEDEFSTLVNPGRRVPAFVSQLTGITDAMLAQAPSLGAVLPQLEAFVGEAPVIGHNVGFDLAFLQPRRVLRYNDVLDTLDLASVLLPTASRYALGALAKELGILQPATHRALDDCRVTVELYRVLYRQALELPLDLLAEIVRLGEEISWGAGPVFESALRSRETASGRRGLPRAPSRQRGGLAGPLFDSTAPEPAASAVDGVRPLQPAAEIVPLDTESLAGLLEHGGAFARYFPQFEHRSEQVQMLRAVARALSEGRHLLVEAGTGTGKSLGYLIPAIHWAVQNGQRVVVSTNTLNLQDQLIHKDVPDLQAALGLDFRAALLKGRSNYLCPRRLNNLRRHGPKSPDEMRVLAKVLVWLQAPAPRSPGAPGAGEAGDARPELTLGPNERATWLRLSAEDEGCTSEMCASKMGGRCPFYRAHQAAEAAHVIVVNHALLLADIASENRVLPEYRYLIIDEAHHLEAATTDGLSFEIDRPELERQLRELGGPGAGLLGGLLTNTRGELPPDHFAWLEDTVSHLYDDATTALALTARLFEALEDFLADQREAAGPSDYALQVRILPATRTLSHWEQVELHWDNLRGPMKVLAENMGRVRTALVELEEFDFPERDDLLSALGATVRHFADVVEKLDGLVFKPDPMTIYWAEASKDGARASLHAAPLHVGPLVEKHLWHTKEAVVMTSATLTTAGDFDYLRGRLNADEADELAVGSPFDYESSTLLYLVNDIPEPQDRLNYQKAVEQGLIKLCTASRGRALVLFTSYAQLKQTAQTIRDPLARAGIDVYDQSTGSSRTNLLDAFRTSTGGVLLGTKSFWEGVDVPGEALSLLVIVKLPFDVPSDPIIAARAETFERPFDEYTVPEAVLKFRQGFGRLIRSKSDRGVVAIFDRRMLTKQYGRIFRDSLPACTVRSGPLSQLPAEAARWIDG